MTMSMESENIILDYLQKEIEKMEKTVKGLEKMIHEKDPEKDSELIKDLCNIQSITMKNIDIKKKKLNYLYNKEIETDNT